MGKQQNHNPSTTGNLSVGSSSASTVYSGTAADHQTYMQNQSDTVIRWRRVNTATTAIGAKLLPGEEIWLTGGPITAIAESGSSKTLYREV